MTSSYNYDYKQILKSALNKQTTNNNNNNYIPFASDDNYAPFTSECTNSVIGVSEDTFSESIFAESTFTESTCDKGTFAEGTFGGGGGSCGCISEPDLNIYDELENNNRDVVNIINDNLLNNNDSDGDGDGDNNLQSCYSLKDNYKIVNNNFKEIAEKILLDNNCDEDKLNIEVSKYDDYLKNKNSNNDTNFDNIINIINIKKEATDKIKLYNIELNATDMLTNKIKNIMDTLNIKNCTKDKKIEEKIKNNISNVIYYNTCFKLSIHLVNQKTEIQNNIDNEQLKINAIMYLLMKNKWLNITTHVHKLLID
jgi:hypothetical protein